MDFYNTLPLLIIKYIDFIVNLFYTLFTLLFLCLLIIFLYKCYQVVKDIYKLTNSKVIVYTYRIGQRPDTFDITKFKHPYITVERMGVIIFVYSTGRRYKNSIFKVDPITPLLDKIESDDPHLLTLKKKIQILT